MIWYEPIEFDYDLSWNSYHVPGNELVHLWDSYGFFVRIPVECYLEEVICQLSPEYTEKELFQKVRKFFRRYKHLYCCLN